MRAQDEDERLAQCSDMPPIVIGIIDLMGSHKVCAARTARLEAHDAHAYIRGARAAGVS